MSKDKTLYLLDAFALIYRAHFAFIRNPIINSKGVNTSATFGFTNALLDILTNQNPSHLGVAFDTFAPTFRHEEFEEYKANREEMPEDVSLAIPVVKKLLKALNIPILEYDGYEADDVIGTIAKKAESSGYKVYMVTPDKDFAQLVTENIYLYKPSRMGNGVDILDPAKVKEKMGIAPEHVVDFLGLKGDKVDNIPGIPRVGDKTAVSLIEEFGEMESIIEQADNISKKSIRESVKEHAEQGLLSKNLARILVDAPVPWNPDKLRIGDPDRKAVLDILRELEFRKTSKRILESQIFGGENVQTDLFGNTITGTTEKVVEESTFHNVQSRKHVYRELSSVKQIEDFVQEAEKAGEVCFDTETTSLNEMEAELIAISMSIRPGSAVMIHFEREDDELSEKLKPVKRLLESESVLKIAQNLKYDMLVLRKYDIRVCAPIYDTLIAHYVIDPDKPHSMDSIAKEYLNYNSISITSLIGKKGKKQKSMRSVSKEDLLTYACEDADITMAIKEKLVAKIEEGDLSKVLHEVELPLIEVLAEMEYTGVKIDKKALAEYSEKLRDEMADIEKEIYSEAEMEFNINSPKQLGEIIYDRMKLGKPTKTKTGQYSTREDILEKLADEHELPRLVLRYRKLGKLKSTYVDALPALINEETGRVHSTFSQAVAATGRLSSNNPNLQNIPIRTEEGREIRKAFIPEDGLLFFSADYSQVELRLMASLSGDEGMKEAFQQGLDIHRATAAKVFSVDLDEVDDDMRAKAKMVNFGIIYGISAFGLAQRLGVSRTEAGEIIENYFGKYPGIKKYMDECIQFARDEGYARTLMGRRRYLPDINSSNQTVRGFAERNAINTPIQGSAAELIKLAMIKIAERFREEKVKSTMILQVHDELIFEVYPEEKEKVSEIVKSEMENAMDLDVPMKVDMGFGKNWLEAH